MPQKNLPQLTCAALEPSQFRVPVLRRRTSSAFLHTPRLSRLGFIGISSNGRRPVRWPTSGFVAPQVFELQSRTQGRTRMSQYDFDPNYIFEHHAPNADKLVHYDAIHE